MFLPWAVSRQSAFTYVNMIIEREYERIMQNYNYGRLLGKVLVLLGNPVSTILHKTGGKEKNPCCLLHCRRSGEGGEGSVMNWERKNDKTKEAVLRRNKERGKYRATGMCAANA